MAYLLKWPRLYLAIQMAIVVAVLWTGGRLAPVHFRDTASYLEASRLSPTAMLGHYRTPAYPLLLRAVVEFSPDYTLMPWIHVLFHLAAVLLLDASLRRFGASPWQAFAGASALLYTLFGDPSPGALLTDVPAKAAAAMAMAFLFRTAAVPRSASAWLGLTVLLALTYQIRPAYLFLVGWTPLAGLVVLRIRSGAMGLPFHWRLPLAGWCAASLLPCLAYCTLRLVAVGHFGLVSFVGGSFIGVAAEWVDRQMVESRLPSEYRPLAAEILRQRQALGVKSPYNELGMDMHVWDENYNIYVWRIAYPAAHRLYGDDIVRIDRQMSGLSRQIIGFRKAAYFGFLLRNFRHGLGKFLQTGFLLQAMLGLGLALFVLRVLVCPRSGPEPSMPGLLPPSSVLHAVLIPALVFAGCKLLLVASMEVTIPRYVDAMALFLPSVCGLWIAEELRKILANRPSIAEAGADVAGGMD